MRRWPCFFILASALMRAAVPALAADEPAYVIISVSAPEELGSSVGGDVAGWDKALQKSVAEIRDEFGPQPQGRERYVGFSVAILPTLNLTPGQLKAQVALSLDLAERSGLPVFFHLDDQHFWWRSPELSKNPDMVEWSDFPKRGETAGPVVPRYWLPWGDPPMVLPVAPPCVACPEFRAAMGRRLRDCVGEPIARRLKAWNESGRGYLLAGVAVGNETQIVDFRKAATAQWPVGKDGVDSTGGHSVKVRMSEAEMAPTGYHSLHALGYDRGALERLAREKDETREAAVEELFFDVARDYAAFQAKTLNDAGLPPDLVYTHFTSSIRSTADPFTPLPEGSGRPGSGNISPPVSAAVNPYSRPGFTVVRSGVDLDRLVALMREAGASKQGRAWAVVESYSTTSQPGVPQTQQQYEEYLGGLLAHGAKIVSIYGWNFPWIAWVLRVPYRIPASGAIPAIKKWLAGGALPATWSGAELQARVASIRAKMQRLQREGQEAVRRGRDPRQLAKAFRRFQREFGPLVNAGKVAEAEAVLDRMLAEVEAKR